MSDTSSCIECGRPWGVVLGRGELPSTERESEARLTITDEFTDYFDYAEDRELVVVPERIPLEAQEIVLVTEALANFASDRGYSDWGLEGGAWYPVKDLGMPTWLLKGRRRRWAYLTGCCELNIDLFVAEVQHSSGSLKGAGE